MIKVGIIGAGRIGRCSYHQYHNKGTGCSN